jgi:hypothetical protein
VGNRHARDRGLRRHRRTPPWRRVFGGIVIIVGVTFISFLTATVTSYLRLARAGGRAASDNETRELVRQLDSRPAAIETTYRAADEPSLYDRRRRTSETCP